MFIVEVLVAVGESSPAYAVPTLGISFGDWSLNFSADTFYALGHFGGN